MLYGGDKELCQNDTIAPGTLNHGCEYFAFMGVHVFAESREKRIKCLQSSVKCGIYIIRNTALKERSTVQ